MKEPMTEDILFEHLIADEIPVYIKATLAKPDAVLVQHRHKTGHIAVLLKGTVVFTGPRGTETHTGPTAIYVPEEDHHGYRALTPVVWLCIHDISGLPDDGDLEEYVRMIPVDDEAKVVMATLLGSDPT